MNDRSATSTSNGFVYRVTSIAYFILRQWLVLSLGIACLLAHFFPNVAKIGGIIRAEYTIMYGAVILIFLISGMSIPQKKLVTHILNWRLHILVQGISYLLIPSIMMALVHLIHATDSRNRIDTAVLAGYMLVSCLPTTIASNVVMTKAAGGDDAAALVEVFVANIMGPFITPGWTVTLLPKSTDFDPWRDSNGDLGSMYSTVFKEMGATVLAPLAIGQIIRWIFPEKTANVVKKLYLGKVSTFCLVLLVWTSFSTCFATNSLKSLTPETIILTVLLNIILYIFFTYICFILSRPPTFLISLTNRPYIRYILQRVPPGEVIAICFCGAAKTSGLGLPLLYAMYDSSSLYQNAQTSVPVILYTTEQIFCAHFMVHLFQRWKARVDKKEGNQENLSDSGDVETVVFSGRSRANHDSNVDEK